MKFGLKNNANVLALTRKIGYVIRGKKKEELDCVRYLSSQSYPRFHLYIKEDGDNLRFNLHLDQKKPSYKGSSAHSGEYEGDLIEKEKERILKIIT